METSLFLKIKATLLGKINRGSHSEGAYIVRVHTASATAEKGQLWILNPGPHRVDFFSKYGHAVYHSKALEELNNFCKRTIG